jgi:UDP-2,4-diacetamido-2,4,6-trideoxy-beta-L-altropyranose hydrolase
MFNSVFFHFKASNSIGLGHSYRCLSLAHELSLLNFKVYLLINQETIELIQNILLPNFIIIPFDPSFSPPIVIDIPSPSILIIDNYDLDIKFENHFRKKFNLIGVIDDLANRPHNCDFLIDQTIGRNPEDYSDLVPSNCKVLAGPHFGLLSKFYSPLREKNRAIKPNLTCKTKKIIISFGGGDIENVTGLVLSLLPYHPLISSLEVVIGSANIHQKSLKEIALKNKNKVNLHIGLPDLASLLSVSDIAIGAGGVNALERCVFGIPSLLVEIAENQKFVIQGLLAAKAGIFLGKPKDISINSLTEKLNILLEPQTYNAMSFAASHLCDGKGCNRVANILQDSLLTRLMTH